METDIEARMTRQRRCYHLRVHRQTVQHRVRLATGGVLETLVVHVHAICHDEAAHGDPLG